MYTSSLFLNHNGGWWNGLVNWRFLTNSIPLHSNKKAESRAKMGSKVNGINQIGSAERRPEKAGVGGSSPSLATTFSNTYSQSKTPFHSGSFQNNGLSRLASRMKSSYGWFCGWLSIPPD